MNGVDPSDFDDESPLEAAESAVAKMGAALASLFDPPKDLSREQQAEAALNRALKYGWTFVPVPLLMGAALDEETWANAVRRYVFMPFQTGKRLTPAWLAVVAEALVRQHLFPLPPTMTKGGQQVTTAEVRYKVSKVRTAFLEMVVSWCAAGGKDAPERGASHASVIALAKNRADVEARVQHFINETW